MRINDEKIRLPPPFSLNQWLVKHEEELAKGRVISLFPEIFQTRVYIIGQGQHSIDCSSGDVWLWQQVQLLINQ